MRKLEGIWEIGRYKSNHIDNYIDYTYSMTSHSEGRNYQTRQTKARHNHIPYTWDTP
jgi:hypothetical protein